MTGGLIAQRWLLICGVAAVALPALFAAAAAAQAGRGPPNAVQGFSQNRNEPIKIESGSLEVRDKEKVAIFIDNVRLTQGDTMLECKRLVVHYADEAGNTGRRGATMNQGGQRISRLEAKGGVVVTQKDQTAVGDEGLYDMKTNRMTLSGNVTVMQGGNVVRGERMWVDLATGVSRVESAAGQGRVTGVFTPASPPSAAAPVEASSATSRTPAASPPRGAPFPPARAQSGPDRDRTAPPTRRAPLQLN